MKNIFKLIVPFFLISSALAQPGGSPPVPIRAVLDKTAVVVGGKARVAFVFEVPKKYHITDVANGLFFIDLKDTLSLTFTKPEFPKGTKFKGDIVYTKIVVVYSTVSADSSAAPGIRTFPVNVGYQVCQEFGNEVCFLPDEKEVLLKIEVVPAGTKISPTKDKIFAAVAPSSGEEPKSGLEARLVGALEQGSWLAFLLVFLGGILASFTPCVYPVIPITIGYIGARSTGRPLRGFGLSVIFVLGIALIYSTLGLISAATGTLFGSISGSPYVVIAVAVIFGLMGLSMIGAFEIALPSSWQGKLQTGEKKKGLLGPLVIGMVSGLVMAPCVGPLIVALLAWVARTHNLLLGWALLFVFSLGLGVLFLVIGTFAGAIQALPKAGVWMEGVKKGFGWILIGAALFLLRPQLSPQLYFFLWGMLLVIFAVVSGALDALSESASLGKRFWKAILLIVFLVGAIHLYRGLVTEIAVSSKGGAVAWQINKEPEVLAAAKREDKPVLIDVYADWCVACKELDEKTYVVPEVAQRLAKFALLKLDFTKPSPWVEEMKRKYEITGMPTVIFLDPSGEEITRFTGFKPASELLALMDDSGL